MGMKVVLEALGLDGVLLWKYTEKEDQGHCLENSGLLPLGVQRPLSLAPATLAFTFPLPIFPWLFLEHTYEPPSSASLDLLFCFPHTLPQLSTSVPLSHCPSSDVLSPSQRAVFWSPSSSETPHLTVTLYQLCLALFRCPGLMTLWHRLTRFFSYSFTVHSSLLLPPSVLDCRFHEMRDHCHCCIYWQIAGAPQMLVEWMNEFQRGVEESCGEGNGNPL